MTMDHNFARSEANATHNDSDSKSAHAIELNATNQLDWKQREAHINFGAENVLNPDGKRP